MSYHVVAFERGDPSVKRDMFHEIGCGLVEESTERVRAELLRTRDRAFLKNLEHVEIYTFGEAMPGYEHALPEWAKFFLPTPEYENFAKVYFLNDLALRMYREGGVEFEVAKVISDEELPRRCTRSLNAQYMPKEK